MSRVGGCAIRRGGNFRPRCHQGPGWVSLVFAEDVNYGFGRNLWGLKPIGMPIAVGLVFVSWTLLMLTTWGRPWPEPWWDVFVNLDHAAVMLLSVADANTAFAAFWLFRVKPSWDKVVADAHVLRLLEYVQTLRGASFRRHRFRVSEPRLLTRFDSHVTASG